MHDDRAVLLAAPDKIMCVEVIWEDVPTVDLHSTDKSVFKTTDLTIAKGDLVACETKTRHKAGVFKVVRTNIREKVKSESPLGWVICKIDRASYLSNKQNEARLIEAMRDGEERRLREQMKKDMLDSVPDDAIRAITFGSGGDQSEAVPPAGEPFPRDPDPEEPF